MEDGERTSIRTDTTEIQPAVAQPAYDFQFAKIIQWLKANGLEMHTPRRGETYVCPKRPKKEDPSHA